MAYYENIDLFVTSDRNHADVINEPLEKIIENIKDTRRLIKDATDYLDTLEKTFADYTKTEDLNELLSKGIKGDKGNGLEFEWLGTSLGVREEGEKDYEYTNLKGEQGDVSLEQLEEAIQEAKTELEEVSLEQLSEVKTELQTEIANIPKVTKTSELTNDSGFITASDIPEIDLEPYALKTQIPTTLPASDVYAWAKASAKPTYTASEVGALPSNGTATNASKVNNALTLQVNGVTNLTYDGSVARTFNLPNASTSTSGVMTKDMVTKLNGIATGATKNTIDTAMSSTSTNAVQNKVIYAYIQEQIKNQLQNAGDYMGKTMIAVPTTKIYPSYTYTNAKGGFADFMFWSGDPDYDSFDLTVDGVTVLSDAEPARILKQINSNNSYTLYELKIPFKSTFTVSHYGSGDDNSYIHGFLYVNS